MAWPNNPRPAKSLVVLRDQINDLFPDRDKSSDGMLGDEAHAARVSDHNPDADGRVNALDITLDREDGPDLSWLAGRLMLDERTSYIIYNRRIWQAGEWSEYKGKDPHTGHLHISVKRAKADIIDLWELEEIDMYKGRSAQEWATIAQDAEKYKQAVVQSRAWEGDLNKRIEKITSVLDDLQQFKRDALKSAQEASEDAELGRKVRELVKR